jgi:excisionase family DNA binding protein
MENKKDKKMNEKEKLVTVKQASKYMGVTQRTIYNWIWGKRLSVVKTPTGRIRIKEEDLLNILSSEN